MTLIKHNWIRLFMLWPVSAFTRDTGYFEMKRSGINCIPIRARTENKYSWTVINILLLQLVYSLFAVNMSTKRFARTTAVFVFVTITRP